MASTLKDSYGKDSIVIIGCGGHSKNVIDAIQSKEEYIIEGILDNKKNQTPIIDNIYIMGDDSLLGILRQRGLRNIALGFGNLNNRDFWRDFCIKIQNLNFEFPAIIHKSAIVSKDAKIGNGSQVLAGAIIGPSVEIGECCIIGAGAVVSHDCIIGSYSDITPGAILGGSVSIGEGSVIGMGATIYFGLSIGRKVTVNNGVRIFRNINDDEIIKVG